MQKLNWLLLIILALGTLLIAGCRSGQNDGLASEQRRIISTQREMIRLQQELITLQKNMIAGQSTIIDYQTAYSAVVTVKLAEKDPDFAIQIQKDPLGFYLLKLGKSILGIESPFRQPDEKIPIQNTAYFFAFCP